METISKCKNALKAETASVAAPGIPFTLKARMIPDSRICTSGVGVPMTEPMVTENMVIEAANVDFKRGVVDENTAPITKKNTSGVT